MRCKNVYIVINPRAGQDMTKITDVIAVLAAAGWHTDNGLVEYGGHAEELAAKAAKHDYDLIVAHGGDGTITPGITRKMLIKGLQIRHRVGTEVLIGVGIIHHNQVASTFTIDDERVMELWQDSLREVSVQRC